MFKKEIYKLLKKQLKTIPELEIPPDPKLGDYAMPCFTLAKELKKAPNKIAEELVTKLKPNKFIESISQVGPYVNFFVNKSVLAENTLQLIHKEKKNYGKGNNKKETVMIEFFHANTHKGVHIGHLRNISIGAAVCNLQEAIGNKVIRVNYQGDIGPHVAKCLWGYLHFKEKRT